MINDVKRVFMYEISNCRFMNVDDLFVRKESIRKEFAMFEQSTKEIYKWYFFYQLCLVKNPLKSAIWEYICGKNNSKEVEQEYAIFCERRDRLANLTKQENL